MVKRKLQALNYHAAGSFLIDDPLHFRSLVLWLEDQVIRHYKIEDRDGLRKIDSNNWDAAFKKYCSDLDCPLSSANPEECLEWIVGFAVRLEYLDNKEKYGNQSAENAKTGKGETPEVISSNPLDNLNFQSPEFIDGVNKLAEILKVTPHPNHLVTLEAISTLVSNSVSEPQSSKKEGTLFPLMETSMGFDVEDYVLNQAAKVLRLLYVQDLRDLQTRINECIVAVQSITANPKTDTSLGKVGF